MNHRMEIYTSEKGVEVNVLIEQDTVWATQKQMAEIFETTPQNITIHLNKAYKEGEIMKDSTCKDYLQVQILGSRPKPTKDYFLRQSSFLLEYLQF